MSNFDDLAMAVASFGGNNAVKFDDLGMPSIMVGIPKMKYSDIITGGTQETLPWWLVSLLSVVCVVTLVLIRSVASLALVLSIFNVPTVPGATSEPSGLIAFHSVLFAPMLQSDFMAFPYGII
jgi:hypothetical protein